MQCVFTKQLNFESYSMYGKVAQVRFSSSPAASSLFS